MFIVEKGSHPKVDHGQLQSVIIEFDADGNITSGDVQYYEGFVDAGNNFQSLGVNHIHMDAEMADWVKSNMSFEDKGVSIEAWVANEKATAPVRLQPPKEEEIHSLP